MDKKDFDEKNEHIPAHQLNEIEISLRIRDLLMSQDFAVLCTKSDVTAYGSLVAFSISKDLNNITFATLNYTRKYHLLKQCEQVAMLIDDRDQHKGRVSEISAVTINGDARKVQDEAKLELAKNELLHKHNYLSELVASDSCVFFNVKVTRYLYVTHLQEVYEWTPS